MLIVIFKIFYLYAKVEHNDLFQDPVMLDCQGVSGNLAPCFVL